MTMKPLHAGLRCFVLPMGAVLGTLAYGGPLPQAHAQEAESALSAGLAPGSRDYAAWLPLYNGVESLSIGVPEGAAFEGLPPRGKPIIFFGTSITQGACASRRRVLGLDP